MLSVREANALNSLLDYLFNATHPGGYRTTAVHARDAAEILAHGASRTLSAGWTPERVRSEWSAAPLAPRRREAKAQ